MGTRKLNVRSRDTNHHHHHYSMGKKLALVTERIIGLHRQPAPTYSNPMKKKGRPDDPFIATISRRPAGRPDKKLSVHSPIYKLRYNSGRLERCNTVFIAFIWQHVQTVSFHWLE